MKMIHKLYNIATILCICATCASCSESVLPETKHTTLRLHAVMPQLDHDAVIKDVRWTLHNVSNASDVTLHDDSIATVIPGLYDIKYTATAHAPNHADLQIIGMKQSVTVTGENCNVDVESHQTIPTNDLIISEIFFAGTLLPSGNPYYGDDYIMLYNNTDHVIYADGLSIVESKFTTTDKYDVTPDIMSEAMTVQAIYTIPGSGRDVAVAPGRTLLICDNGMDHRIANPLSFDLSNADFEWYDVSTSASHLDIDTPVPNLDKWYCYTKSYWMLHNRGFRTYALARIPIDRSEYLADYLYTYSYEVATSAGSLPMSQTAYRLPNEWIVDAVTCSVAAKYAWQVCSPMLDSGWTYCGTHDHDTSRYFHSVRRKVQYVSPDGIEKLQDTNDSSADFIPMATPSMMQNPLQ